LRLREAGASATFMHHTLRVPYELLHESGLGGSAPIVGGVAGIKQLVGLPEPRHQGLKHETLPADP